MKTCLFNVDHLDLSKIYFIAKKSESLTEFISDGYIQNLVDEQKPIWD